MRSKWGDVPEILNELANEVIGHAIGVHMDLGPGLLEKPYKIVLAGRLQEAGHQVDLERPMPLVVNGVTFDKAYVADLVVDDILLIEVKAVRRIEYTMIAQVKTYLRLSGLHLGLLLNFHGRYLAGDDIKRVVP